jgi:hypothetical protein
MDDFGCSAVDAVAHFRGTFVRYRRWAWFVVAELDPESNDLRVILAGYMHGIVSETLIWDLLPESAPAELRSHPPGAQTRAQPSRCPRHAGPNHLLVALTH